MSLRPANPVDPQPQPARRHVFNSREEYIRQLKEKRVQPEWPKCVPPENPL